jgi:multicomponent K+:H+ antiporter subunit D
MRIGLHYVVFNVTASTLFLIALGLLYASLGSLNMAELSQRIAEVPASHLTLVKATLGLLLLVFCSKAALMPLYLWLPEAYARAPAAVAALFAIMTKVGLYAVLRVSTLWFGEDAGPMAGYGSTWLLWAGIATLVLGGLGVLAAARLRVLISYLVVVSAATLFIAFSIRTPQVLSAGLYYLPHSTFVAAALFLVADLIRRRRGGASDRKEIIAPMPGKETPAVLFLIGAVSVAGLPPLSGFLAKAALLAGMPAPYTGVVWAAVLGSSLMVIVGITRGGIRLFWRVPVVEEGVPPPRKAPTRTVELLAAALLLCYGIGMSVFANPLMQYTDAMATQLLQPHEYVGELRATTPEIRNP